MITKTETNPPFNDSMAELLAVLEHDNTPRLDYDHAMSELVNMFGDKLPVKLTGLVAVPPEQIDHTLKNNFWAWVCSEYHVGNNMPVWLDLDPALGAAWVRHALRALAILFPDCVVEGEIKLYAHW